MGARPWRQASPFTRRSTAAAKPSETAKVRRSCSVAHEGRRSDEGAWLAGAVVVTISVVAPACVVATASVVTWADGAVIVRPSTVNTLARADPGFEDDRRTASITPAMTTTPTAARTTHVKVRLIVL